MMKPPRTASSSPRLRYKIGACIVAAVTAGAFQWLRTPLRNAHVDSLTAASVPTATQPIATGNRGLITTPVDPKVIADSAVGRIPRNARLSMDDVDDARLYGLSPELLHFVDIQRKAVRSQLDKDEALMLASDPGLIDEAVFELSRHDPSEQQAIARRRRMALVDFLIFAIARGSEAPYVARVMSDIVASSASVTGEPLEIRKTFAGDRIELAWALEAYAPDAFERLRARVAGSPAEKIVDYVASLDNGRYRD